MPGCSVWPSAEALRIRPCHGPPQSLRRFNHQPHAGPARFRFFDVPSGLHRGSRHEIADHRRLIAANLPHKYFLKVEAVTAIARAESTANGRITKFGCTEMGIARYTTQASTMLGQTKRFAWW